MALNNIVKNSQRSNLRKIKFIKKVCDCVLINIDLNPFTLRAAKRGLTILDIFPLQKHFFENI